MLERKRDELPADVVLGHERQLEALKEELEQKANGAKERELSQRYRMVNFFERRKALRKVQTLQKKLSALTKGDEGDAEDDEGDGDDGDGGDEDEDEEEGQRTSKLRPSDLAVEGVPEGSVTGAHKRVRLELARWQQDLNYLVHFPRDKKYISLYPPTPCTVERTVAERREVYQRINREVDEGKLALGVGLGDRGKGGAGTGAGKKKNKPKKADTAAANDAGGGGALDEDDFFQMA